MDNVNIDEPREEVPEWAKSAPTAGTAAQVAGEVISGQPKITQPQRKFLLDLIAKKYVKPDQEGKLDLIMKCLRISEDPEEYGMSKRKASELITWFLEQPNKTTSKPDNGGGGSLPEVAEGRYAVPNEEGKLAFYFVKRPKTGKWAGWTFIDVFASDERHPIKGFAAKKAILEKIAADPDAGPRFGREIGSCYVCGRTLTDEVSRRLGIGPVCRSL